MVGCGDVAEDHHLEHVIPKHKPRDLAASVVQLELRGAVVLSAQGTADARRELLDIVRWLPELAADSDLRRPQWERVTLVSRSLEELLLREHGMSPREDEIERWNQLTAELETLTAAGETGNAAPIEVTTAVPSDTELMELPKDEQ